MAKLQEAKLPSLKDKILAEAEEKPKVKKVKKLGGSGRTSLTKKGKKNGKK